MQRHPKRTVLLDNIHHSITTPKIPAERKKGYKTAGEIRKGLTVIFRHVQVRRLWNKKHQKFGTYSDEEFAKFEKYAADVA